MIGLEIQQQSDRIKITTFDSDAAFLSLSSTVEDSVKSDENTLNLLGSYTDPVFGDVEVIFSPTITIESFVDFGDNPILSSAVLYLTYAGYYGDSIGKCK